MEKTQALTSNFLSLDSSMSDLHWDWSLDLTTALCTWTIFNYHKPHFMDHILGTSYVRLIEIKEIGEWKINKSGENT